MGILPCVLPLSRPLFTRSVWKALGPLKNANLYTFSKNLMFGRSCHCLVLPLRHPFLFSIWPSWAKLVRYFSSYRVELLAWRNKSTTYTSRLNRLTPRKKHSVPWEITNWEPSPRELRYAYLKWPLSGVQLHVVGLSTRRTAEGKGERRLYITVILEMRQSEHLGCIWLVNKNCVAVINTFKPRKF